MNTDEGKGEDKGKEFLSTDEHGLTLMKGKAKAKDDAETQRSLRFAEKGPPRRVNSGVEEGFPVAQAFRLWVFPPSSQIARYAGSSRESNLWKEFLDLAVPLW